MKLNNKQLGFTCLILWFCLIGYFALDIFKVFGTDIGMVETLKTSSLARGMFMDVGLLSTILAFWIAFYTKNKFRYFFAIAALFVGSLAVLPYLSIYFFEKSKNESK